MCNMACRATLTFFCAVPDPDPCHRPPPPRCARISVFGSLQCCGMACVLPLSSQAILISGESGAGKTEATKQCFNFLAEVAGSQVNKPKGLRGDVVQQRWVVLVALGFSGPAFRLALFSYSSPRADMRSIVCDTRYIAHPQDRFSEPDFSTARRMPVPKGATGVGKISSSRAARKRVVRCGETELRKSVEGASCLASKYMRIRYSICGTSPGGEGRARRGVGPAMATSSMAGKLPRAVHAAHDVAAASRGRRWMVLHFSCSPATAVLLLNQVRSRPANR